MELVVIKEAVTMTNEEIIFRQGQELAKAGKIGFTGQTLVIKTEDGGEVEVLEAEPIHTFAAWKELGFSVKKGERIRYRRRQYLYQLRQYEKKGRELEAAGVTMDVLDSMARGCDE